jgi:hypothetical protein
MTREQRAELAAYIVANPLKTYQTIALEQEVHLSSIQRIASEFQISRPVGKKVSKVTKAAL